LTAGEGDFAALRVDAVEGAGPVGPVIHAAAGLADAFGGGLADTDAGLALAGVVAPGEEGGNEADGDIGRLGDVSDGQALAAVCGALSRGICGCLFLCLGHADWSTPGQ